MCFEEKCQVCVWMGGAVIIGRALRRFPVCVCVYESRWSTSSMFILLSRADTSGSLCTSRHTPESPARYSHTGGLHYTVHTRAQETHREKNTHTHIHHNGLYNIGHSSSCIKQRDGDRQVQFREGARMGDRDEVGPIVARDASFQDLLVHLPATKTKM